MNEANLRSLQEYLPQVGIKDFDIPYEEFKANMELPENREAFYNYISPQMEELGTFEDFELNLADPTPLDRKPVEIPADDPQNQEDYVNLEKPIEDEKLGRIREQGFQDVKIPGMPELSMETIADLRELGQPAFEVAPDLTKWESIKQSIENILGKPKQRKGRSDVVYTLSKDLNVITDSGDAEVILQEKLSERGYTPLREDIERKLGGRGFHEKEDPFERYSKGNFITDSQLEQINSQLTANDRKPIMVRDASLKEVSDNYGELINDPNITGMATDPSWIEGIEMGMTGAIAAGLTDPSSKVRWGTAIGLGTFMAIDEVENIIISKVQDDPYVFGAGKNISDLLPKEAKKKKL